jgi:hypothetical protein
VGWDENPSFFFGVSRWDFIPATRLTTLTRHPREGWNPVKYIVRSTRKPLYRVLRTSLLTGFRPPPE